jgi:hypothetical protein
MNKNDYLDIEAQEGSDNEAHDHVVKKISNEEEEETRDDDHDEDLEDLVTKYTQTNRDVKKVQEKYREEELKKDKEQVKEIISQGVKAKKRKFSEIKNEHKFDDELLSIHTRIKKERKEVDTRDFDKKIFNISKYKKKLTENSEDDGDLTEVNEMLENFEQDVKKKISQQSTDYHRKFKERMIENEKNIEDRVINLNEKAIPVTKPKKVTNHNSFLAALETNQVNRDIKITTSFQSNVHRVFRNPNNTKLEKATGIFEDGFYEPGQIVKLNNKN